MTRHMLIVEDEQDIGECLKEFFTSRGFTVVCVFSGEEALERFAQLSPDVILLDILLPGLSGMEVLKRIKAVNPQIRVVMVTALDQDDLRLEAHRHGAAAYITKPFDFSSITWNAIL